LRTLTSKIEMKYSLFIKPHTTKLKINLHNNISYACVWQWQCSYYNADEFR